MKGLIILIIALGAVLAQPTHQEEKYEQLIDIIRGDISKKYVTTEEQNQIYSQVRQFLQATEKITAGIDFDDIITIIEEGIAVEEVNKLRIIF